ncbi:MAG: YbjQ family protein [Bacillota bacterium]
MLLSTTDLNKDYEVLGMVRGSEMKAVNLGKDISAFFRKIVGGNVKEYSDLLVDARDSALAEMEKEADSLGADAVIGVRFATSTITNGAAEIVAYGTAVKF